MSDHEFSYNDNDITTNPLANPIIDKKYERKTFQLIKAVMPKRRLFRGVKEVKKAIRRQQRGLVIMAADVAPFDVISAFPVKCENAGLKYYFVKSKRMLSKACGTKQTAAVVMIQDAVQEDAEDKKRYIKLVEKAQELAKALDTVIMY